MLRRLLLVLVVNALAMTGAVVGAPAALTDPDDDQIALNERVRESLFYIQMAYTGRVFVPPEQTNDGRPIWSEPTTIYSSCTGFAVDPAGFVATAGHCV
ncbi:MAG: serine protease, partial [Mycolicibacterium sp.]